MTASLVAATYRAARATLGGLRLAGQLRSNAHGG